MALTFSGNVEFTPDGPWKWTPGKLLELDAVEIPYKGPYDKLTAFRSALQKWAPSSVDRNMFLESFPDDGATSYPRVLLRFIGCRQGKLPASQSVHGKSLATASYSRGEGASLDVLYRSPHTVVSWISTAAKNDKAGFTNPEPDIKIVLLRVQGTAVTNATPQWQAVVVANYFTEQEEVTDFRAAEIVPGRYWLCTATTSKTLAPR